MLTCTYKILGGLSIDPKEENMKKTKWFILALVAAMALMLAACGTEVVEGPVAVATPADTAPADTPEADADNADEADEAAPADETASDATGGEIVWVANFDTVNLDPIRSNDSATADATAQMMEGLTIIRGSGELEPLLAESYTMLEDGYTWEFNLNRGIMFHDGTPFTAEAVRRSLGRALDPEEASPAAFIIDMIEDVVVVDEYTVHIITEFPFAPLPAHLAHPVAFIISPAALDEEAAGGRSIDANPVGTGPFRFDERVIGDFVRFVRFDDYWRGPAQIESLLFRTILDAATRVAMVEVGEANAIMAQPSDVFHIETLPHVDMQLIVSTAVTYIGLNNQRPPFDNPMVRQAIAMAINREDILYGIAEGQGVLSAGPLAPTVRHSATNVPALPFDPDRARALLEEAGYGDGFEFQLLNIVGMAARSRMIELVQANLAEIGITVNLGYMDLAPFLEVTAAGEFDAVILGWTTVTGDADYGVYSLFHSDHFGGAGNRTFYANPRIDELLDAGRRSTDPAARDDIYREITEILIEDAPMIFLFHPYHPIVTNGIGGLDVNFNARPIFYYAYLR